MLNVTSEWLRGSCERLDDKVQAAAIPTPVAAELRLQVDQADPKPATMNDHGAKLQQIRADWRDSEKKFQKLQKAPADRERLVASEIQLEGQTTLSFTRRCFSAAWQWRCDSARDLILRQLAKLCAEIAVAHRERFLRDDWPCPRVQLGWNDSTSAAGMAIIWGLAVHYDPPALRKAQQHRHQIEQWVDHVIGRNRGPHVIADEFFTWIEQALDDLVGEACPSNSSLKSFDTDGPVGIHGFCGRAAVCSGAPGVIAATDLYPVEELRATDITINMGQPTYFDARGYLAANSASGEQTSSAWSRKPARTAAITNAPSEWGTLPGWTSSPVAGSVNRACVPRRNMAGCIPETTARPPGFRPL